MELFKKYNPVSLAAKGGLEVGRKIRTTYLDAVRRATLQGAVEVVYCRIMLLGPGGVGKTSLKRGLMGLKYNPRMNSTIVADVLSVTPVAAIDDEGAGSQEEISLEEECLLEKSATPIKEDGGATPLERKWITDDWREVTEEDEINELARLIANVKEDETASIASRGPSQLQQAPTSTQGFSNEYTSTLKFLMNSKILDKAFQRAKTMDSSDPKPSPFYHVWDCGGQPVFQEVLPVFLTARTMFLLLFNASESLHSPIKLLHYVQGKEVRETGFFNVTTLQLLEGWMSNIHSYLLKTDEEGAYLEYPRVIPIGTRGDQLTESNKKKVNDELVEFVDKKAFRKVLKSPAIIDNTTAGLDKGNEDPAYSEIRKIIFKFATKQLVEVTPITWVIFRKVLNLLATRCSDVTRNTITFEQAKAIGTICKIPPEDVEHVLKFYHDLGVLLYYPYIKGLEDTIILNPKWFVECLGKILTLPGIGKEEEFERRKEWELLRTKGILVQPLYAAVWKGCEGVNPSNFIDLLAKFQLAVEVNTNLYDDPKSKQYFLPAVLPYAPQNGQPCNNTRSTSSCAAPLHITFRSGYVTPGFFTRFVTRMADIEHCKLYFDKGIYHNRVMFKFLFSSLVTLTDTADVIEVAVQCLDSKHTAAELREDCLKLKKHCEECCELVEDCLHPGTDEDEDTATSCKISSEIKIVCQRDKCSSDETHYLEFNTCKMVVCCEKSNNAQDKDACILAKEACWFEYSSTDFLIHEDIISKAKSKLDEATVYELLKEKHNRWNEIGRELGIEFNKREEWKNDPRMNESSILETVIHRWFEITPTEITWKHLGDALKNLQLYDVFQEMIKLLQRKTNPSDDNGILCNDHCGSLSSNSSEYFDVLESPNNSLETQL